MSRQRGKKADNRHITKDAQGAAKSPRAITFSIPNPLTIAIQPDPKEHQRYSEERSYRASQLRAAKILNGITIIGIAITVVSLIFLYLTVAQSRKAMQVDQRAWITVKQPSALPHGFSLVVGAPPKADLFVENTGKTPAKHVSGNYYIEIVPSKSGPRLLDEEEMHLNSSMGFYTPNTRHSISVFRKKQRATINGNYYPEDDPLTQEEQAAFASGAAYVAVYGTVFYDDVFNEHHWIRFCYWTNRPVGGNYNATSCSQYNDVDAK